MSTPPLSFANTLIHDSGATMRIMVSVRPSKQNCSSSEASKNAEHLLAVVTERARKITVEIDDAISDAITNGGMSDGAETRYSEAIGMGINDATIIVEITVHIPRVSVPIEQLVFRIHEVLGSMLAHEWNVIDPGSYERVVAEEEDEKRSYRIPFIFSRDDATYPSPN